MSIICADVLGRREAIRWETKTALQSQRANRPMPGSLKAALAAAGLAPPPGGASADAAAQSAGVSADVSPVGVEQIAPGLVVLDLDPSVLLEDRRVTCTGSPALRSGPFVCVWAVDVENTVWAGLTRKQRIERLSIEAAWRKGGSERWRTTRQFLSDGANLWHGPKDAFAAAAWRETFTDPAELPRLTATGLDAVRKKCEAAATRRKRPVGAKRSGDS